MTNLSLTSLQKEMLLEMCKALFPDYNICYFRIDSKSSRVNFKDPDEDEMINNNILRIGKYGVLDLSIHWFEFCMTHLTTRLAQKQLQNGIDPHFENNCSSVRILNFAYTHPVDYLYKEFKKLKLK
jgi:hypothetical protein